MINDKIKHAAVDASNENVQGSSTGANNAAHVEAAK